MDPILKIRSAPHTTTHTRRRKISLTSECAAGFQAADKGFVEVVRFLVEEGKADVDKATTDVGATPLFIAAQIGHTEVVRFLVEEGKADVDKVNKKNQTPINIAVFKGRLEVVHFLLSKGADCTIKDKWGDTPETNARAQGHAEVAAALAL